MKAKHARQIRAGILTARTLFPDTSGLSRLGKKAYSRETWNFLDRLLAGKNYYFRA